MRSKRMPESLVKRVLTHGEALFEQERGFDMIEYLLCTMRDDNSKNAP